MNESKDNNNGDAKRPKTVPDHLRLAVSADVACQSIGVSPATWARMSSAGKTPSPIKLSSGCVRWRVADLEAWVAAGCPSRAEFESAIANRD